MFVINKESEVPLYQQLVYSLKKCIKDGILKKDDKIPAESEFCSKYDLSRTTVRQALKILEKEGYIYKIRGKGSYISSPKIYQDRSGFSKFYDDVKNLGKIPASKILSVKVKKPNELVREKMNLSEDEFIVKLVWVRYGNDEALIYETIYLNYSLVKGIENINLKTKKLYDVLNEEFGIKITHGKEMFYPCKLNTTEAKYLELAEGDLGMKVERTTFQGDKILEYTKSTVRGDKFIYMTTFSGNNHY
ncbi:MAG: GntR family transcriptional regulator [Fusobacterium sp.]|uniref:GntR family transcriptional regulator n=1 Tax=Fusobacterium sp. TaxID=68766 RepID=UPI00399A3BED